MSKRTFGWCGLVTALLFTVVLDAGAQEGSIEEAIKLKPTRLTVYRQERYGEAIPLIQQALEIHGKLLGPSIRKPPPRSTNLPSCIVLRVPTF